MHPRRCTISNKQLQYCNVTMTLNNINKPRTETMSITGGSGASEGASCRQNTSKSTYLEVERAWQSYSDRLSSWIHDKRQTSKLKQTRRKATLDSGIWWTPLAALHPAALASVPYGVVLVRVRVPLAACALASRIFEGGSA